MVSLERLYEMRDLEKCIMRQSFAPASVRHVAQEHYDALDELINARLARIPLTMPEETTGFLVVEGSRADQGNIWGEK